MDLKNKVINLVDTENKKNPLTDVQIAKYLHTTRENITNIRKELNINNSRQRRYPYLKAAILAVRKNQPNIAVSDLTCQLIEQGFAISRKVIDELLPLSEVEATTKSDGLQVNGADPFKRLIGSNGSLKNSIEQAKAAILYPPKGLPTLLTGESGVGKSLFSKTMYDFAKGNNVIHENGVFIVFNCADYGDNPQLLLSLLFGYKKGAFTGAVNDTPGLVEQADGGILFLDEIHRLPPKGQEILFSILDRGCFRRLGESGIERAVNLMFIGATTESLEDNLLLTFRRRIPMIIQLPALKDWFLKERVELIYTIFQAECNRINAKIFIDKSVVEILALKEFKGNIGQLKSMIQVLCAHSFMNFLQNKQNSQENIVSIEVAGILKLNDSFQDTSFAEIEYSEIRKYLKNLILIPFGVNDFAVEGDFYNTAYQINKDIYRGIETKYDELKNLDLSDSEIENILWAFILNRFSDVMDPVENELFSFKELKTFVRDNILKVIKEFMDEIIGEGRESKVNKNAFKYLAIHLEEAIKKIKLNQRIVNLNMSKIKKEFVHEYSIGKQFAEKLEQAENIKISEDEIAFIALYMKAALHEEEKKKRVGLIVVSHGNIASATVKVIKDLLGMKAPMAIDMPLNEKPINIYNKAVAMAKAVNQGCGVLFLVDMGSLTNIGDIVMQRTGIKTRMLDRMDLLIALEAARKVSIGESDLDEIYFSLCKENMKYNYILEKEANKQSAIITICLTGEGNAKYISQEIEAKYPQFRCYAISALDENIMTKINEIRNENNILAIIGTINPKISGINFIPYDKDILKNLELYLSMQYINDLAYFLDDELILYEPEFYIKRDLLEYICSLLINKGYVKKAYLSSVLHREELLPTFSKGNTAVPHGTSAEVLRTKFVFVKLKEPIDWVVGNVNFLLMPVFTADDKDIVKKMLTVLQDETFMKAIRMCTNGEMFKQIIMEKVKKL
ncbi:transcriptional regulator with AAA-type ATPase domain/transcriptional regulatory protein LevR [Sporomusaceae bacterium BoRhaA]|uniref:sigma 54-interacting transcriptional regulator n=1 Tax=Pelorhabdus rhamnosifermentans TaxID=2772457 RepID=UPI001C0632D9|nr:sigma 54-interacting transcriptional regulator [Pelorhabdus rhamnosifermentans]MBU2700181.1 transcriptional regulator with AAA-type ATPase domain/transcriptional regulatory protein LevR [Pelorhabdus rhamnosifermentans]